MGANWMQDADQTIKAMAVAATPVIIIICLIVGYIIWH